MAVALYPGKFDPFHNGHLDVVSRASALFARVVVAVYDTPSVSVLFDTAARLELVRQGTLALDNVEVVTYTGLTVACARRHGAAVVVRGLRNLADFEYEYQVGMANRQMAPDIELCCLITGAEYAFLSATILKEVASLDGPFQDWAPAASVEALRAKYAPRREGQSEHDRVPALRSKLTHQG